MEDQHSLPTLSSIPLRLMFWPVIVRWFWTEDKMLRMKCWMKADQSCRASWANSVGTTVDAFERTGLYLASKLALRLLLCLPEYASHCLRWLLICILGLTTHY